MRTVRQILQSHGWLIAIAVIASFTMLFRLDAQPIQNWDEGIHGAVSLEMVEDGDWLTPHYMGGPYFRKPPLKLWMSSALFEWFGANAWTLRLPSALAGIATALLIAWWIWQWRRNRLDAFLAGIIVATMRPIFFHGFRTGEMDGLLTFWIVLALYAWWRITESSHPRWWVVLGTAIGLGVMTKSAAGLLPIPIILAHAMITGAWRRITLKNIGLAFLTFTAIAAPWHIVMTVLHGATFWQDYFGWHVVKRATETLHNEAAGTWWYLGTFARRFTPYTYVFVPALLYVAWMLWARARGVTRRGGPPARAAAEHAGGPQRQDPERGGTFNLLLIWFLLDFALFTLMKTKLDWYLLPLYPAAAMLVVWLLAEIRAALPVRFAAAYAVTLVLLFGAGGAITAHHLWRTDPPNPFTDIAAAVRRRGGVLVSYALDYKQHPAGYFILRNALRDDVRILDGKTDVARTHSMLREESPALLLTRNEVELPEELRAAVRDPRAFDGFTLWQRL